MLSPIGLENTFGPFLEGVALCHRQIIFVILRKNGDEKNRKSLVTPDVHDPCPPLFPIPLRVTRTFRNPPVPRIRFPHSGSAATSATMSARSSLVKSLAANAR